MSYTSALPAGRAPADTDLVRGLLAAALLAFDRDRVSARRYVEQAQVAVQGDVMERPSKGLLADWQTRRAENYIKANIGSPLRINDVAKVIGLSASYFSRAFKVTTGISYSDYVMRARVEHAKTLLLASETPIVAIALECGLADQSHLTRMFSRIVGLPPSVWRRQQVGRLAMAS